ncbi:MAG: DNA repair protein RadC [Erysipelotrichia bacterium]|nr:DNA repair protein RadC [Erysipelotrichia bacterium]
MEIHLELMGKIKDLPPYERPREKAERYGLKFLSNHELLALVISSGTKKYSALEIAQKILNDHHGLGEVSRLELRQFLAYEGVSKAIAAKLAAVFELAHRAHLTEIEKENNLGNITPFLLQKYSAILSGLNQEVFLVISLDKKRRITKEKELYVGTEKGSLVSLKEIIRELLLSRAAYLYLIHNHPNGFLYSSDQDIILTQQIMLKSKELGIELLDHLIIGGDDYYSFKTCQSAKIKNLE